MDNVWHELHKGYKERDWIDKPSIFAETAITYFPTSAAILELGAGQGQDSRYFAEHGHMVTSTDIEASALEESKLKLPDKLADKIIFRQIDLQDELPFKNNSFDVIYAHLSLHYFNYETTLRLFGEIQRVLKPGGVLAFFANSTSDPEYGSATKLEDDFFQVGKITKRYFSIETTRAFTKYFNISLLDNHGETYKDQAKGVHGLVRFIGSKPLKLKYNMAIPYCGAIIQREQDGRTELLLQTRWKPHADPVYSGTLEFPAGVLDKPYESVFDTIAREIKEESGLSLKEIKNNERTKVLSSGKDDEMVGFRPFCCTQQLRNGKPWVGFIFICEVSPGVLKSQLSEARDAKWMEVSEVRKLYEESPGSFFGLELPAWEYYFSGSQPIDIKSSASKP